MNFLSNRYQQVKITEYTSQESRVTYGVPQSSILGPHPISCVHKRSLTTRSDHAEK